MSHLKDLTGQVYGNWKVLGRGASRVYSDGSRRTTWTCQCIKNPERIADKVGTSLQKLSKPTCQGCSYCFKKDLTGKVFGKLTVLREGIPKIDSDGRKNKTWTCICSCENHTIKDITAKSLVNGTVKSCGCLSREKTSQMMTTHGKSKTALYNVWSTMKARCNRITDPNYYSYGGRGIKVCEEWENDFSAFEKWSLDNGYQKGLSIDRIDNNKWHSPDNCRWTTLSIQANNKRNTRYLTVNGETKPIAVWAREKNVPVERIRDRILVLGWSDEDAVNMPFQNGAKKIIAVKDGEKMLFSSCAEVAEFLNAPRSSIYWACKKVGRLYCGYNLYYEDQYEEKQQIEA